MRRVLFAVLLLASVTAWGLPVRLATYNVLFGVGAPGSAEYIAVRSILQRVNPDIIGFQELLDTDYDNWVTMAADLGYPHLAYGPSAGPLTGSQRLGFFSRYPIRSATEVTEYPGATELTRYPLRVVVDIPGALNPFVVYTVHLKASSGSANQFRRAIEGRRTLSNLVAYIASNPMDTEYAIIGDFNEDVANSQPATFTSLPTGLPTSYQLGSDVIFPIAYRFFPTDRFVEGGLQSLTARQEDSTSESTYSTGGRLDYLLLSQDIRENPYGAPVGEIYNSTRDDGSGGLPKFGAPLSSATSANASDHFLVFADFNMIDALPCINPVLFISEIAAHPTPGARFIELHNSGASSLAFTNHAVVIYLDGNQPVQIPISGTLPAGDSLVIAGSTSAFQSVFGFAPDRVHTNLLAVDGNEVIALLNSENRITDLYGVLGEPSGPGDFTPAWSYPTGRVVRVPGISDPLSTWNSTEWSIGSLTVADPGFHVACNAASVFFQSTATLPSAPRTGDLVQIVAEVVPNATASNLVLTAFGTLSGAPHQDLPMTLSTNGLWFSAPWNPGASDGASWTWYVTASFSGPGAQTVTSSINHYTFPLAPVTPGEEHPRFNEVEPDDASSDDREFIELIAPAGMNLAGYRISHYNGSDTSDGSLWTHVLPAFVVPDDGVTDDNGNPLGFCVLTTNNSLTVGNIDLRTLPGLMQNGPDGLVLYDPASNVVDAVTWNGAGDMPLDDPGTVVTNGDAEADIYLHQLAVDTSDNTHQAPNNVLGDPGPGWRRTTATPGAVNAGQTSGYIRIRSVMIGDQDGDSFADNVDNCPDVFNPIQTDLDNDGLGDACDPDRDGDTIPDASDNCPSTPNTVQSDQDGDGLGDACDPDRDNDGIENDEDLCPDTADPLQQDLDGDGVGDACDTDDDGDGTADLTDNCPLVANSSQENLDGDSLGDACDPDLDGDGVDNAADNCPLTFNPLQTDANLNGVGDDCEQDSDADGVPDLADNCPLTINPGQRDDDADGFGDACDPCTGTTSSTNRILTSFSAGLPAGWTITTNGQSSQAWRFDDPVFRGNRTGGAGLFAIAESSIASRNQQMATQLRTPIFDLRQVTQAELSFRTAFDYRISRSNEVADVDISLNGTAGPWSNLWRRTADITGSFSIDITPYTGSSNTMIRFHYYGAYQENYWQVDDVTVACTICIPPPDADGDGLGDPGDNCPGLPNPDQSDLDQDGIGDACDADRDGDSLPDAWEVYYFSGATQALASADEDLDGFRNIDEYISGTDPTNGMSRFSLEVLAGTEPATIVQIPESATGRIYTLQWRRDNVTGDDWQAGIPQKTGTGSAVTFTITNDEPVLFFRAGARVQP